MMDWKKQRKTDAIKKISIMNVPEEPGDYLGELLNTYYLMIYNSPECKNPTWASKLKNIQYLDIFNSQIEDISWTKEMKLLTSVHITDSPISDLSVLSEHKNIHLLHLENLNVWDISFVEKYQHLFSLKLVGCPIKDFSPLFRLPTYLKSLVIDEKLKPGNNSLKLTNTIAITITVDKPIADQVAIFSCFLSIWALLLETRTGTSTSGISMSGYFH